MVIKCPNCNHYVSDTSSVCPKCGIHLGVSDTTMNINNVTEMSSNVERPKDVASQLVVFPELVQYLRQLLKDQEEEPNKVFHIEIFIECYIRIFLKGNCFWENRELIRLGEENSGFCLVLGFYISKEEDEETEDNKEIKDEIQRFRSLEYFSQFMPHKSYEDNGYYREYALDLGDDIDRASFIISEILQKVYLVQASEDLDENESIDILYYPNEVQQADTEKYIEPVQTVSDNNKYQKWIEYGTGIGVVLGYLLFKSCT